MSFETTLKNELKNQIIELKKTSFYQMVNDGKDVKQIYTEYLKHAYHFVINSSCFTPLAARRMDPKYLRVRKWILDHSGEEMGHELMALKDLEYLGVNRDEVINSPMPIGVTAWVSFFHYKVTMTNPFNAFGVLYFLEGMAQAMAPEILKPIIESLEGEEKKAITFFREHGELDDEHLKEQESLLFSTKLEKVDEEAILQTVKEAAQIKTFMLETLVKNMG